MKYWFSGERGPSGDHLVALARHLDAVLYVVLRLRAATLSRTLTTDGSF